MRRRISRLHCITQDLPGISHSRQAELACLGGADWIQLRVKNLKETEILPIALETLAVCRRFHARLIINDYVPIAMKIQADGVHLGKEDLTISEARQILGPEFLIGGSTNTRSDIQDQIRQGADYIGIGPLRFTSTREKLNPVLGLDSIRMLAAEFGRKIPMIAIGGIRPDDTDDLLQAGVHGLAAASVINLSPDPSEVVRKFTRKIEECLLKLPSGV